jgi:hypothetical protein
MLRKKRNGPKLAALKQRAVLIAFFLRFSGPINGDPDEAIRETSRTLLYRHDQAITNLSSVNQRFTRHASKS